LGEAKKLAATYGYKGAMFPWQSGSTGVEETQIVHLNPMDGTWGDDYSCLQRHVNLAILYNVWNYYEITGDKKFMAESGAELFFEICRFWISKCELREDGRYHVDKVMGPDEYHESTPGSSAGGLCDNAYTNLMLVWSLEKAFEIKNSVLTPEEFQACNTRTLLLPEEFQKWEDV
jgi:trehalose/maltose hydrolase-like predicted phosphorylase